MGIKPHKEKKVVQKELRKEHVTVDKIIDAITKLEDDSLVVAEISKSEKGYNLYLSYMEEAEDTEE